MKTLGIYLRLVTRVLLYAAFISLALLFFATYATQEKAVILRINRFGEADLELFLVVMTAILVLVEAPLFWKDLNGADCFRA